MEGRRAGPEGSHSESDPLSMWKYIYSSLLLDILVDGESFGSFFCFVFGVFFCVFFFWGKDIRPMIIIFLSWFIILPALSSFFFNYFITCSTSLKSFFKWRICYPLNLIISRVFSIFYSCFQTVFFSFFQMYFLIFQTYFLIFSDVFSHFFRQISALYCQWFVYCSKWCVFITYFYYQLMTMNCCC